jgi:UTP-glucose-1-phosphate uridylyltransferase
MFAVLRRNGNWIDAAKEKHIQRARQKDFGLIDAVILVKQKVKNATVVSGDYLISHNQTFIKQAAKAQQKFKCVSPKEFVNN